MDNSKKIIKGLLTATPTAITIQQLAKDYRNTMGEPIPYHKFGYKSLEHFLFSIPDTVRVQGSGQYALLHPVLSEKSSHIMQLVSQQRIERPKGRCRTPFMKRQVVNNIQKSAAPPKTSTKMYYPPLESKKSVPSSSSNSKPNNNTLTNENKYKNEKPHIIEKPPVMYDIKNSLNEVTKSLERTHMNIQKLRESHMAAPIVSNDFDDIPSKKDNLINNKTSILRNNSLNKNLLNKSSDDLEESVPQAVRNNLKNLISHYPNGIWCTEVPNVYRSMFKRELQYQNLGFHALIDLCSTLKSIFYCVRPSTDDFKLYDKTKPLPAAAEKYLTLANKSKNTSINALPAIDWSDLTSFLPPDVFELGKEIPRVFVPPTTKVNDTLDVIIGEVYDVSKFWVYIDDGQLNKLMDDMQEFYRKNAKDYALPPDIIREGLYCVAFLIGEYHRALIVDVVEDMTRVFFIDYGTVTKVKSTLYFLHKEFAQLPAQTIRCRLANICPPVKGLAWSIESSKEFRQLIKKRDLTAKISTINWKDQYLEIFLADVTDSNNVFYINDVLVEKEYAVYSDREQKKILVDSLSTPIVNLIHLFPTFLEIEHGLAPSTSEMEMYHYCNTPLNFCYPQYFNINLEEEERLVVQYTEFWETKVSKGLRRMLHHNLNMRVIKDEPELDFSIFGELENEMREFAKIDEENSKELNTCDNNNEVKSPDKKIKRKDLQRMQLVTGLKEECRISEDIIKDISKLSEINVNHFNDFQFPSLNSLGEVDITKPIFNSFSNNCGGKHPFQDISFTSDKKEEKAHLNKDLFVNFEPSEDLKSPTSVFSIPETIDRGYNINNPFLQELDSIKCEGDLVTNNGRLNTTNPFLSYIPPLEEDNSDKESTSTDYSMYVGEVKVGTVWSKEDQVSSDMSVSEYSDAIDTAVALNASQNKKEEFLSLNDPQTCKKPDLPTNPTNNPILPTNHAHSNVNKLGFNVSSPEFYPQYFATNQFYGYPSMYQFQFPRPMPYMPNFYNSASQTLNPQLVMQSNYNVRLNMPASTRPCNPPPGFKQNDNVYKPPMSVMDFYTAYNNEIKKQLASKEQ